MKHIFAFERKENYDTYGDIIEKFNQKLKEYQMILEADYELRDLPKAVVWTTGELATTVFSDIPIPAPIQIKISFCLNWAVGAKSFSLER